MVVTQAPRKTERISLAVTFEEKRAVLVVAAANGVNDHSVLLRDMSLKEIVGRARKMKGVLRG